MSSGLAGGRANGRAMRTDEEDEDVERRDEERERRAAPHEQVDALAHIEGVAEVVVRCVAVVHADLVQRAAERLAPQREAEVEAEVVGHRERQA